MKALLLCLSIWGLLMSNQLAAQTSFSVSDTVFQWQVDVYNEIAYNIINITNNTTQYMDMVYEVHRDTPFPTAWITQYTPPTGNRYVDNVKDTFVLVNDNSLTTTFYCLFVPNWTLGTGTVRVKFYPLLNPSDTAWVRFTVTSYSNTPVSYITKETPIVQIYPNPCDNIVQINVPDATTNLAIYTILGEQLTTVATNLSTNITLDTHHWTSGIYWVRCMDKNNKIIANQSFIKH